MASFRWNKTFVIRWVIILEWRWWSLDACRISRLLLWLWVGSILTVRCSYSCYSCLWYSVFTTSSLEKLHWGLVFLYVLGGMGRWISIAHNFFLNPSSRAVFEGTNKAMIAEFFPEKVNFLWEGMSFSNFQQTCKNSETSCVRKCNHYFRRGISICILHIRVFQQADNGLSHVRYMVRANSILYF